ncbi:MAG: PilC/PilY family type IV pilus protein, partial [Betaproteobacteria bacterium]
ADRDNTLAIPWVRAINDGALPAILSLPAPYPSPLLPASQDAAANWMDEFAGLLRRSPYPVANTGSEGRALDGMLTYAIALHDPLADGENSSGYASGRALIRNAAIQGGGKYFDATDVSSLTAAIRGVFAEAQSVSAVFASASLPASVNAVGTFANEVYMAMFRPEAGSPRWLGNLKQYQFAYDSSTDLLELVDAEGQPAIDAVSGFIAPTAQSAWSTAATSGPILPSGSATVNFFVNAPSGIGGTPEQRVGDAPDGEVVEKGGAAQRLRARYLGNQISRKLFTCPPAGCSAGASLAGAAAYSFDNSQLTCGTHQAAFGVDPATCPTELPRLIDWIRGADNTSPNNESMSGPGGLGPSPIRPSIHGDVIHSRPLLVDYGAAGSFAFYGANDGTLRAMRAGQGATGAGDELWGFIAPENLAKFKRLREATPPLQWPSSSSGLAATPASATDARPKDHFFDGTASHYVVRDRTGTATSVYLFATARRGGAFIYALDVTDPLAPKFLWRHAAYDRTDPVFDDLALTFSTVRNGMVAGYARPVAIFGGGYAGGYDSSGAVVGEDADPTRICVASAQSGCGNRIYVLDAESGQVVKTFQVNGGRGGNLSRGVAADVTLVDTQGRGIIDRAYAVDTGGGLWRMDFDAQGPSAWQLYKVAQAGTDLNPRKFLQAADAVVTKRYTAILVGSGDREKPLKATGADRFYMFKDKVVGPVAADGTGLSAGWPIDADSTALDNMVDVLNTDADQAGRSLAAPGNNGWFYALEPGEKVVNAALTAAGIVYFGTNQPATATPGTCSARLGTARAYGLRFNTGTPGRDLDNNGVIERRDAALVLAGGGMPPSPTAGLVTLRDSATGRDVTVPFVIGAGGAAGSAAGLPSQNAPARIAQKLPKSIRKTYWYQRPVP